MNWLIGFELTVTHFSLSPPDGFSLSVVDDHPESGKSVKHYRIYSTGGFGELYIAPTKKFKHLFSLVSSYQSKDIYVEWQLEFEKWEKLFEMGKYRITS